MNNGIKKNKLIFSILLLFISSEARNKVLAEGKVLILSASFVFAAKIETNFPTIAGQKPGVETTFPEYVKYLFNLSMFAGAIIVFGILIWSGFRYITSRNNPVVISDVKKKIYSAFLGLLILLSAYVILKTINPQLVILSLSPLSSSTSSAPEIPSFQPSATTFQEIPLGTIVEDILAGNVSTTTHPDLRCYEYSTTTGDTIDQNKDGKINEKDLFNYNSFYCVKLLNDAFQIKINKLIDKVNNELRPLFNGCSCNNCKKYPVAYYSQGCETKTITSCPGSSCQKCCSCTTRAYCTPHCSCCGEPRGTNKGCPGIDPCPNRGAIDCKRQEIQQLIDGGELIEKGTPLCPDSYSPDLDPEKNPKVLTLEEAKDRMNAFAKDFVDDLNNLKEAEKLMKIPYGDRLTMSEFFDLKVRSQIPIEKTNFKNYNSSDYCREFSCTATNTQGICTTCGLNKENRMCKLEEKTEYYVKSGDGATFYFNEEYKKENIVSGEKCAIDPKEEKGIQVGLIPIGEVVDDTEKFAEKMAALYDLLTDSYQKAIDLVLNLNDSPNNCDCGINCTNKSDCHCDCPPCSGNSPECTYINCTCGSCSECNPIQMKMDSKDPTKQLMKNIYVSTCCHGSVKTPTPVPEDPKYVCSICEFEYQLKKLSNTEADKNKYSCCEYFTEKDAQNVEILKAKIKNLSKEDENQKAKNEYGFCNEAIKVLPGYAQIIENVIKRMDDLFNAKNLEEGDMNKCTILDKLSISREKLEKCLTGFGVPVQTGAAKMRTLACRGAWDSVRLPAGHEDKLIISPSFPYPATDTQLNCYPFNSEDLTKEQKLVCLTNTLDSNCATSTSDLLDNYYCCVGGGY
jgi:hypothetical protein